jgi:hypothetical protein
MLRAQAVADIVVAQAEGDVLSDEVLVHRATLDDGVGDVVQDREVRLRREGEREVGEIVAAVLVSGQHGHLHVRMPEPAVGHALPQDRMHLRHVGAP